jgi:CRISPR-associated protein Cas1
MGASIITSPDSLNALLSLGYMLLYNHTYDIVNVVGMDPYQGFFHQVHHGHAALASDLMEEFRAILVNSVVLWTANKGLIRPQDFRREERELRLTEEGLKRFLSAYDQRLQREIVYPPSGERTSYLR